MGRFEYIYCSEDETLRMRKGRVKTLQQIFCRGGEDNAIEQGKTDPLHNFAWLPLLKALKREAIQALGTNTAIFRILLGKHPAYTAATILQFRRDFLQGICGHFFLAVRDATRLLGKIK